MNAKDNYSTMSDQELKRHMLEQRNGQVWVQDHIVDSIRPDF